MTQAQIMRRLAYLDFEARARALEGDQQGAKSFADAARALEGTLQPSLRNVWGPSVVKQKIGE